MSDANYKSRVKVVLSTMALATTTSLVSIVASYVIMNHQVSKEAKNHDKVCMARTKNAEQAMDERLDSHLSSHDLNNSYSNNDPILENLLTIWEEGRTGFSPSYSFGEFKKFYARLECDTDNYTLPQDDNIKKLAQYENIFITGFKAVDEPSSDCRYEIIKTIPPASDGEKDSVEIHMSVPEWRVIRAVIQANKQLDN
ncbi:MAG: hypothetical protein Q8O89_05855 [Nanoarchaeota archaeon]|nr:hypothetical protein [Nanoarchaeota archaeon]